MNETYAPVEAGAILYTAHTPKRRRVEPDAVMVQRWAAERVSPKTLLVKPLDLPEDDRRDRPERVTRHEANGEGRVATRTGYVDARLLYASREAALTALARQVEQSVASVRERLAEAEARQAAVFAFIEDE